VAARGDSRAIVEAAAAIAAVRWLADENFHNDILALCCVKSPNSTSYGRRTRLTGTTDEVLLAWAAGQNRFC
jgi:hypothetical protein